MMGNYVEFAYTLNYLDLPLSILMYYENYYNLLVRKLFLLFDSKTTYFLSNYRFSSVIFGWL